MAGITAICSTGYEPGGGLHQRHDPLTSQAALALPLRSGDRTVGVLAFLADTPRDPDDPIVGLLSGIAAHLAQYLERRRAKNLELALALPRTSTSRSSATN